MQNIASSPKTWIKIITGLYILKILRQGPAHGNKIAEIIKRRTEQTLSPNPNFLYPLLRFMEENGYITGEWTNPSTRGKRVYSITTAGTGVIPALEARVAQKLRELERRLSVLRRDLLEEDEDVPEK